VFVHHGFYGKLVQDLDKVLSILDNTFYNLSQPMLAALQEMKAVRHILEGLYCKFNNRKR
jgi:hypothetical protein